MLFQQRDRSCRAQRMSRLDEAPHVTFLGGIIKLSKFVLIKITKLDIVSYGLWIILAVSRCRWSLYRRLGPDGVPAADWRLKTMQCSVSSPTSLLRPETGLQSPDRPWPARPPPRAGASPAGEAALISRRFHNHGEGPY